MRGLYDVKNAKGLFVECDFILRTLQEDVIKMTLTTFYSLDDMLLSTQF
jgi:hypothetical protein